ncbi:MAG: hypothetical protein IT383_16645 [Deltaproteobacteria bacterium]|nr:hypothetical protein [Deltaproteobacteria bacterium]
MARKTTTTTTGQTARTKAKATQTRRVTSLVPKGGAQLSSLEEAVVRMHHGVSVKASTPLATNGATDELMGQLFEMEVRAHVESGRIDELPDVPAGKRKAANARTAKLVDRLKKKQ